MNEYSSFFFFIFFPFNSFHSSSLFGPFPNHLLTLPNIEIVSNLNSDEYPTEVVTPTESLTILRRQEERLRHLQHASKCQECSCSYIWNCKKTRALWIHVVECENGDQCSYEDCVSSKYVLAKYAQYVSTEISLTSSFHPYL